MSNDIYDYHEYMKEMKKSESKNGGFFNPERELEEWEKAEKRYEEWLWANDGEVDDEESDEDGGIAENALDMVTSNIPGADMAKGLITGKKKKKGKADFITYLQVTALFKCEIYIKKYLYSSNQNSLDTSNMVSASFVGRASLKVLGTIKNKMLDAFLFLIKHPQLLLIVTSYLKSEKDRICYDLSVKFGLYRLETKDEKDSRKSWGNQLKLFQNWGGDMLLKYVGAEGLAILLDLAMKPLKTALMAIPLIGFLLASGLDYIQPIIISTFKAFITAITLKKGLTNLLDFFNPTNCLKRQVVVDKIDDSWSTATGNMASSLTFGLIGEESATDYNGIAKAILEGTWNVEGFKDKRLRYKDNKWLVYEKYNKRSNTSNCKVQCMRDDKLEVLNLKDSSEISRYGWCETNEILTDDDLKKKLIKTGYITGTSEQSGMADSENKSSTSKETGAKALVDILKMTCKNSTFTGSLEECMICDITGQLKNMTEDEIKGTPWWIKSLVQEGGYINKEKRTKHKIKNKYLKDKRTKEKYHKKDKRTKEKYHKKDKRTKEKYNKDQQIIDKYIKDKRTKEKYHKKDKRTKEKYHKKDKLHKKNKKTKHKNKYKDTRK